MVGDEAEGPEVDAPPGGILPGPHRVNVGAVVGTVRRGPSPSRVPESGTGSGCFLNPGGEAQPPTGTRGTKRWEPGSRGENQNHFRTFPGLRSKGEGGAFGGWEGGSDPLTHPPPSLPPP